jgi:signal transduction histidine kinase
MDPELPDSVIGDPQRLRQVLVNVVGNAIKFTQQGKVVVRVTRNSLNAGCAEVLSKISDTGIGVSPEKHTAIFEGFTQSDGSSTRKYGGTGLGLSISSRLVELMHGKIWVESQLGHGSTLCFTVQMPVTETASKIFHPEPAEVQFLCSIAWAAEVPMKSPDRAPGFDFETTPR